MPGRNSGGGGPRYALVIFDFDGTLANSGDWFLSIAGELARRFRFREPGADAIDMLRGLSSREVIRYLGIPRWKLPAISRYVRALLAKQIDRIALFEGIEALIGTLAANGVRIAIVSSNAENNVRAVLGPANVARIETFACGASLFGKARLFRRVLRNAGLASHQVISIGDETRDITAARKTGITAGAVFWGYASREALMRLEPDAVFETPDDVVRLVLGGKDDKARSN